MSGYKIVNMLPIAVLIIVLPLCNMQSLPTPRIRADAMPTLTTSGFAAMTGMERRILANPAPSAHSASLAGLGGNRIVAAWYAGSREGAADVDIVFSIFDGESWSPPKPIMTRGQAQSDTGRWVGKLGNPVLWYDASDRLHLWFVSVGYGGWAVSAINHTQSDDEGASWSPARRLITSPFFNISTLVRGAPLALADGGVALPVYHEFATKRPEWLRFDAHGQIIDKQRLPASARLLQPTAVALDEYKILVLLRDAGSKRRIHVAHSADGGANWTPATATALPNPNAGIALLRLMDGRLLLASNPKERGRDSLGLQISADDGQSWSAPFLVESGTASDEYSYPALLQDETGVIHLAYTLKRQAICHLRFKPSELGILK